MVLYFVMVAKSFHTYQKKDNLDHCLTIQTFKFSLKTLFAIAENERMDSIRINNLRFS